MPGLTSNLVRKYFPNSVATVQGHLNQRRKMQDPHKYPPQPQFNPETQKNTLYLQQFWMQEKFDQTKQVISLSHTARK